VLLRRALPGLAALLCASCGGGSLSTTGLDDAGAASPVMTLRNALAGAWSFDGNGKDHGGHGLDLETGTLPFAAAKFGQGLKLAGEGTPIAQRPKDDPTLNLATGDFTVSFWIAFAATGAPQFVAVKGYNEGGWFVGWAQTTWAFGPAPAPNGGTFTKSTTPATGSFHHVVFERTGNTVELSVDGSSAGTATMMDTQAPAMTAFQVGGFAPGGVSMAHGMSVVNGVVDDLAIWHRALVPDELAYLATHAVP
jgi:hypothetical protein